jgi:hypothetical protein
MRQLELELNSVQERHFPPNSDSRSVCSGVVFLYLLKGVPNEGEARRCPCSVECLGDAAIRCGVVGRHGKHAAVASRPNADDIPPEGQHLHRTPSEPLAPQSDSSPCSSPIPKRA